MRPGIKIVAAVSMKLRLLVFLSFISLTAYSGPKKPTITGQNPLSTNEDQPITLKLSDLKVSDPDDFFYPLGFTMTIYDGPNYTHNGYTVTPAPNFFGTLTVKVSVNDGQTESNKYDLKITVNPVNDVPVITAQQTLNTPSDTPLTITLANLTVSDPDNTYPNGFSLNVQAGNNYTFSGSTVTPNPGFTGVLVVPVTVNDGISNSPVYNVNITVETSNKKPVITGQTAISIAKNTTFTIQLSYLTVTDPDNTYPNDFTLIIYAGPNYTFSGTTITPSQNFVGTLAVSVAVNDGTTSSNPFSLQVKVQDVLTITGQTPLEILEDEKTSLQLSQLQVYDPNNQYPAGYQISLVAGENYTFTGAEIQPAPNFTGTLNVGVTVTNGTLTSPVYNFIITVKPLNDPPQFTNFPTDALPYSPGDGPVSIVPELIIDDPDDTYLILVEIGIPTGAYQVDGDQLSFINTEKIHGVFDPASGKLSLLGQATHEEYQQALQDVHYDFVGTEDFASDKSMYIRMSDGKDFSISYQRAITVGDTPELDIPTVFSPNSDEANDTWRVRPYKPSERLNRTIIRVFNQRGLLVYETSGFDKDWDGRLNGEVLPAGTYFYTIDLNQAYATRKLQGTVTILR